jgi:hypothetical protein
MARAQGGSKSGSNTISQPSTEGNVSTDHDTRSGQFTEGDCCGGTRQETLSIRQSANKDVAESPTDTDNAGGQRSLDYSFLNDLKYHSRRSHDPKDDDDAEYTPENDDIIEVGTQVTTRRKSAEIGKQLKQAERTQ